jgi:hypothetical protein
VNQDRGSPRSRSMFSPACAARGLIISRLAVRRTSRAVVSASFTAIASPQARLASLAFRHPCRRVPRLTRCTLRDDCSLWLWNRKSLLSLRGSRLGGPKAGW